MLRLTCFLVSKGLLPVLLLAWMLASAGTGAADGGQAEIERLKQRVNGYFSAVHSRQLTKAGEFILPRSRDTIDASRSGKTRIDQPSHRRGETGRGPWLGRGHHQPVGFRAGG